MSFPTAEDSFVEWLDAETQRDLLMDLAELRVALMAAESHGRIQLEQKDIYDTAMHECDPDASFTERFAMIRRVSIDAVIAYLYVAPESAE